jgi:hypothetical protein
MLESFAPTTIALQFFKGFGNLELIAAAAAPAAGGEKQKEPNPALNSQQ